MGPASLDFDVTNGFYVTISFKFQKMRGYTLQGNESFEEKWRMVEPLSDNRSRIFQSTSKIEAKKTCEFQKRGAPHYHMLKLNSNG